MTFIGCIGITFKWGKNTKKTKYKLKTTFIGCIGTTFKWEKNTKNTKYKLTGFGHIFRPYYYPHIGTKIKV